MTLEYADSLPTNQVSFPPGVSYTDRDGGSSKSSTGGDSWSIADLTPTQEKTFRSAYNQLDKGKLGYITIKQFSQYIAIDASLKTKAEKDAYIAKVDKDTSGKITFAEFAKWMATESAWVITIFQRS